MSLTISSHSGPADRLISRREAATMLGVTPLTLRHWEDAGRLKAIVLGPRTHRYRVGDIEELIADGSA